MELLSATIKLSELNQPPILCRIDVCVSSYEVKNTKKRGLVFRRKQEHINKRNIHPSSSQQHLSIYQEILRLERELGIPFEPNIKCNTKVSEVMQRKLNLKEEQNTLKTWFHMMPHQRSSIYQYLLPIQIVSWKFFKYEEYKTNGYQQHL